MRLLRALGGGLDRAIGRASYRWLRPRLDPAREYTQLVYARTLRDHLTPSTRWLDAGCGHMVSVTWRDAEERAVVARAGLAVGCDLFAPSLARHRSLDHRVQCSVAALPFRDGSFDLVTLNMVAEHLEDPGRVFAEIARALDGGGRLVIHTPNVASYFLLLVRLGRRLVPERLARALIWFLEGRTEDDVFPTHYRANTRADLARLLRECAIEEERVALLVDRPFFYFFLPLAVLEILFSKALQRLGWQRAAADTILGVYRRAAARAPRTMSDREVVAEGHR
jgi:SAM-dependent methyltransferase